MNVCMYVPLFQQLQIQHMSGVKNIKKIASRDAPRNATRNLQRDASRIGPRDAPRVAQTKILVFSMFKCFKWCFYIY